MLPGITLVLVGEPILTLSSNPALRGVNLEVVGETTLLISIAIDNGRNNTVGGGCYSAHQAVSKFVEHNIDMVS